MLETDESVMSSISKVSSTLSPRVLILAEYIEVPFSWSVLAIFTNKPGLSAVSMVSKFLFLSFCSTFEILKGFPKDSFFFFLKINFFIWPSRLLKLLDIFNLISWTSILVKGLLWKEYFAIKVFAAIALLVLVDMLASI